MPAPSSTRPPTSTGRSSRLVYGAFAYAGQVCISVQRIYVVAVDLRRVRRALRGQGPRPADGQPARSRHGPGTDGRRQGGRPHARVGAGGAGRWARGRWSAASRTGSSTRHRAGGRAEGRARLRRGGLRAGGQPVRGAGLRGRRCAEINDSQFGLQCGVFTNDLERTLPAHDELEVGGVIVNDVPDLARSTRCRTAASRTPGWAARGCAGRSRT